MSSRNSDLQQYLIDAGAVAQTSLEAHRGPDYWSIAYFRELKDRSPAEKAEIVVAAFDLRAITDAQRSARRDLQYGLLRSRLQFDEEQLVRFANRLSLPDDYLGSGETRFFFDSFGVDLLDILEEKAWSARLPAALIDQLHILADLPRDTLESRRALLDRVDRLIEDVPYGSIRNGGVWPDTAKAELQVLPEPARSRWEAMLHHAATATASKPSARWLKEMAAHLAEVTKADFFSRVRDWLALVSVVPEPGVPCIGHQINADILKGLIWGCGEADDEQVIRTIAQTAIAMFKKVPHQGVRSGKIGNACVHTLSRIPGELALAQLALLKVKIKTVSAQKEIEKALNAAAERLSIPREDLEEMAVPSYGLSSVGRLEEPLGDFTVELAVSDSGRTTTGWRKADGSLQKSVPAAIKADHAEELKDLKTTAKDIEKMLPAQRERIDRLFLQEKRWPVDVWRERYLDHPLVGVLARRLIWTFKNTGLETSGIWLGDSIVNVDDEPIDWVEAEGTTVELWHPIGRPMDDVLAWRHWLERHEVRQPFKQAHREVYVLTDAERRTGTYSNRYAAHVLRQHQFNALCAARGWKNQLRLMVDASYTPPTKWLERWGLRAEFWIETIGDVYGTDTTDSGTYLYLTTDQVRFYRLEAASRSTHAWGGGYVTEGLELPVNQPLPLELIPPIVFSEVMRDVDLFVGVASVGNDPTWADGGPGGRYREYWQTFSFGDLTPSAQTRKQVLERLVPKLKIGPRCSFSEKFLVVRGDLRTYKIHLGSGNILMEPNDQYLCIVPDSSAVQKGDGVFLPFEGDRTLSIVLSKAMLLADDRKITDSTIVRQIEMG